MPARRTGPGVRHRSGTAVASSSTAAALCDQVGHPLVGVAFDTFHANIEEKDIRQAIKTCADQTVHVHISENDRSTPGEGHVDWATSFAALKETGYDGWFIIEACGLTEEGRQNVFRLIGRDDEQGDR